MASSSPTPSLTPSIGSSPPPNIPVQPDHFYHSDDAHPGPSSPRSIDGKTYYDPEDDRLASRGIPVFKPTMEEFRDFEAYMNRVECWGMHSGIVKVIPPKEWTEALPPLKEQLSTVKIRSPIEQHMLGRAGLFRQQNLEKRKVMSVREWAELCGQQDFRAPGVEELGLHARANVKVKTRRTKKSALAVKAETADPDVEGQVHIKEEPFDDGMGMGYDEGPGAVQTPIVADGSSSASPDAEEKPKINGRRQAQPKLSSQEKQADRIRKDIAFLETFDPHSHWLPPNTKPEDYTPEFCAKLERHYWRNCGLGKPPWYGADTQGSLYTDETQEWNVAHLESELSRLLPSSDKGLPGVNTPYLYWGMWRATFAWHVEDMDLFSINYIHFGAPKFWYAIPQGRASSLEHTMRSYFPKDTSQCPQFLRHKSFLASPTLLAKSSCKPNQVVQHAGEFIITYPRGYHAGFNLGLNCAESVNFALTSWIELGKVAKACKCIPDSVVIDVEQLLEDRAREQGIDFVPARPQVKPKKSPAKHATPSPSVKREEVYVIVPPLSKNKRKAEPTDDGVPKAKKAKTKSSSKSASKASGSQPKLSITLKLGPRPPEPESFPCCLCVSMSKEGLLRVHDPPFGRKEALEACGKPTTWRAHEMCANVVPETWVDEVEDAAGQKERVVFGVDGIVKDRWNLKCTACTRNRPKAHGAPIQCTKGKCPKAFHVSCARDGKDHGIIFDVLREVEKEVVLVDPTDNFAQPPADQMQVDSTINGAPAYDAMSADTLTALDHQSSVSQVLKVIRKIEVQVLCIQHNPAVAAAKKASKQDRVKNDLLALTPMSRIKIRVSTGVFEVSLVRVIEETSSVEVLWDRGLKREFKWGSVVFGNTDGPVQQKPSEPAPDPPQPVNATHSLQASMSVNAKVTMLTPPYGATVSTHYRYNPYDYWNYQHGQAPLQPYGASPNPSTYSYGNYYPNAVAGPSSYPAYNPYIPQQKCVVGQLHWQQPYQGPTNFAEYHRGLQSALPQPQPSQLSQPSHSSIHSETPSPQTVPSASVSQADSRQCFDGSEMVSPTQRDLGSSITSAPSAQGNALRPTSPFEGGSTSVSPPIQSASQQVVSAPETDFEALASLQPAQIADLIRDHEDLRNVILSVLNKDNQTVTVS